MSEDQIREFRNDYQSQLKELKLADRLKDRYEIIDILKESDGKAVFLLKDKDGRYAVLKQYDREFAQLPRNEYEILKKLQAIPGACCPKPLDYWAKGGFAYVLREYCEGRSLLDLYESGWFSSEERVLLVSIRLCRLLSVFHAQKPPMIHRDIKPANFVYDEKTDRMSVIDCDSVRIFKEGKPHDTLFLGTPSHTAPEAYGYSQCDVKSDVFGLGKTILYLCCGRADDEAVQKCDISKELLAIIKKCIAFSPEDRYKKVMCVEEELLRLYERRQKQHTGIHGFFRVSLIFGVLVVMTAAFFAGMQFERRQKKQAAADHVENLTSSEIQKEPVKASDAALETEPQESYKPQEDSDTALETDPELSLAETIDGFQIDVFAYQELADEVITCYYEMDMEGLGTAYDRLLAALYDDTEIKKLEGIDIAFLEELPKNFQYRSYPQRLSDYLIFDDALLYKKIGHFGEYAGVLYDRMDRDLSENTSYTDTSIYRYVNGNEQERDENYKEMLMHLMSYAVSAVLTQDQIAVKQLI